MTLALDTCSKQTKTAVKKTNDNITTQTYLPFIDKLSITLTMPPEEIDATYERVLIAINFKSIFQAAKWSQRFKICRNIALSGTEERVLFQFAPKTSKGPDCRLEFNPTKLGFDDISSLDTILSAIFPTRWLVLRPGTWPRFSHRHCRRFAGDANGRLFIPSSASSHSASLPG